jgi:hypothetical protein
MDLVFLFFVQVWKMRQAQIAYFRHRKQSDLIDAKKYETLVDTQLAKRLIMASGVPAQLDLSNDVRPTDASKQASLFEQENNNEATKDQ